MAAATITAACTTHFCSGSQMKDFGGDTPYSIMFGPDICGYGTRRVHVIFTWDGTNYLIKKTIPCKTDRLSHIYTLIVRPNNTYEVRVSVLFHMYSHPSLCTGSN